MSSQDMRLMFGELTANEIRTIRAVLQAIIRDINNEQSKESNFCCCIIWLWISSITFSIRHPWATDAEIMLYIKEALLFEKVPYKEMTPRE